MLRLEVLSARQLVPHLPKSPTTLTSQEGRGHYGSDQDGSVVIAVCSEMLRKEAWVVGVPSDLGCTEGIWNAETQPCPCG